MEGRQTQLKKELEEICKEVRQLFEVAELPLLNIFLRTKSQNSSKQRNKFREESLSTNHPHDLLGLRVILESEEDCYTASSIIKENYKVVRYRDYISRPWKEGYQSIHIDFQTHNGRLVELQLRTNQMDECSRRLIKQYGEHYRREPGFRKF